MGIFPVPQAMANAASRPHYNASMTSFLKMHGLGNDFVVFDARDSAFALTPAQARAVADRHFGIGCDTVVVIRPGGAQADASLLFYNADGTESESCFNASRCVARLLLDERGVARVNCPPRAVCWPAAMPARAW